jgi:hypothetical protein
MININSMMNIYSLVEVNLFSYDITQVEILAERPKQLKKLHLIITDWRENEQI